MKLFNYFSLLVFFLSSGAWAITGAEYSAVKNTLLKEMSNHHDFTTEGLFHGLADGLGLTDAAQHLYVGSPTASEGYRAIYRRLCQLSKDNGATAEQRATVAKLEKFMHDIGLA
ncbi:hypothetical protein H4R99_001082 [Coemansia sp. RSA 1722]|nr:hypothetical protein H4R99_001082 [Coemansia sp. RSA 1722]